MKDIYLHIYAIGARTYLIVLPLATISIRILFSPCPSPPPVASDEFKDNTGALAILSFFASTRPSC